MTLGALTLPRLLMLTFRKCGVGFAWGRRSRLSKRKDAAGGSPSRWKRFRRRKWLFRGTIAAATIIVLLIILFGSAMVWPSVGAKGTAAMRVVLGDQITAKIEGAILSAGDWFHRVEYSMGVGHDADPLGADTSTTTVLAAGTTTTTMEAANTGTTPGTGVNGGQPGSSGTGNGPGASPSTTTSTEPPFAPAALTPMGSLDNEGRWQPYITDQYQRVVAYRTALQPDAGRGYAHAVIVAMDVHRAQLHFVLGYEEPVSKNRFDRPGVIPAQDFQQGVLLGAFNGGFQAKHGQFGAMADGQVALPARDGLGTLAIYSDGSVDLGAWGTDIQASADIASYRQNGPLMVSHGEVNPHTADFDPKDWGYVFGGGVATFRSGLGISKDRQTLFYVVGPSLTTQSLAAAMRQAGIWNGIQLDINRPWTRFDKALFVDGKFKIQPAVDGIAQGDARLFHAYKRDFFYLTAGPSPVS